MEEFSMLDAFKALSEVSDDIIYKTPKRTGKIGANRKTDKALNEVMSVDLNSTITPEEGEKVIEKATAKAERPITIVDMNADTVEHVKDKVDYVGQVVLKCKRCQGLRFIDMDKLVSDEANPDIYNVGEECPVCHTADAGYETVGQITAVPEEKPEEENEVANDEASAEGEAVENDNTEETETTEEETNSDENVGEEESSEEIKVDDTVEDEQEQDFSETDAVDDTEDVEDAKLGDEVDSENVEEDDTDTNESLTDGKLRGLLNGLNESDGQVLQEEEEIYDYEKPLIIDDAENDTVDTYVSKNRNSCSDCKKLNDLFSLIVEPENIEQCEIYSANDPEKLLYRGTCGEIPETFKNGSISGFDTAGCNFILNTEEEGEGNTLADILKLFVDTDDEIVCVNDQESGEDIFYGKRDDAVEKFGKRKFISAEAPEAIVLYVIPDTDVEEIKVETTPKDELLADIFKANDLSPTRLNNRNSIEAWVDEALTEKEPEDLDNIYSSFIRPTHSRELIEKFKSFTGYKDALDRVYEEFSDLFETKAKEDKEEDSIANAQKLLEENPDAVAIIYGYLNTKGKFFSIDPIICKSDRERDLAAQNVELKYHCHGLVRVLHNKHLKEEVIEESLVDEILMDVRDAALASDLDKIANSAESAWEDGALTDDEYNKIAQSIYDKMDSIVDEAMKTSDKETINEDVANESPVKDLNFIRDMAIADLENDTPLDKDDYDEFEKLCIEGGIQPTEELFNTYFEFFNNTKALDAKEALEESIDDAHKLNPEDKVILKLNGEEVFKGPVKELFKEEKGLKAFYDTFNLQNGNYVGKDEDGNWELVVTEKAKVDANTEEAAPEDATNEQLEKETDPDEIAVLQNMRDAAEDEMDYCDDHNDPMGTVRAAKRIDRIDEEEKVCEKCGKPIKECSCVKEEIVSYKNRKELGEAIEKCKANDQQYKVTRSKNEGYRYDLTILHEDNDWQGDTSVEGPDDWIADELELGAIDWEAQRDVMKEIEKDLNDKEVQAAIDTVETESGIPSDDEAPEDPTCPVCGKDVDHCTCIGGEFDVDDFDGDINAYFDEAYETPMIYTTDKGYTDENGNIVLEGLLESETSKKKINFLLIPNKDLKESEGNNISYKVLNDLSEEVFEFTFNK